MTPYSLSSFHIRREEKIERDNRGGIEKSAHFRGDRRKVMAALRFLTTYSRLLMMNRVDEHETTSSNLMTLDSMALDARLGDPRAALMDSMSGPPSAPWWARQGPSRESWGLGPSRNVGGRSLEHGACCRCPGAGGPRVGTSHDTAQGSVEFCRIGQILCDFASGAPRDRDTRPGPRRPGAVCTGPRKTPPRGGRRSAPSRHQSGGSRPKNLQRCPRTVAIGIGSPASSRSWISAFR